MATKTEVIIRNFSFQDIESSVKILQRVSIHTPEATKMVDIAKQWLTLGIDGFRIDAVSHLERAEFVDVKNAPDKYPLDWHKFSNLPKVHDYLKMLNKEVFKKGKV